MSSRFLQYSAPPPPGDLIHHHVKFQHNRPMCGWVIDNATNFTALFSGGTFCRLFIRVQGATWIKFGITYVNLSSSQCIFLDFRYIAAFRNQKALKWTGIEYLGQMLQFLAACKIRGKADVRRPNLLFFMRYYWLIFSPVVTACLMLTFSLTVIWSYRLKREWTDVAVIVSHYRLLYRTMTDWQWSSCVGVAASRGAPSYIINRIRLSLQPTRDTNHAHSRHTWSLVRPVSKTHGTTLRRQSSSSSQHSCASSQNMSFFL